MTKYAKKRVLRLHKCESCFSYYENRVRAKRCHNERVLSYDGEKNILNEVRR